MRSLFVIGVVVVTIAVVALGWAVHSRGENGSPIPGAPYAASSSSALGDDAHPEATAWVDTRGHTGSSVVPSPQPAFIRSATVAGPDPLVLQVQLVALVHNPVLDLTFWQMARIEVRHGDGGWAVLDYQPTPVSERVEFSQPVWENVMGAGEGWRRFEVVDRGLD